MKRETFYKTLNAIVGAERLNDEEAYIINDYVGDLEYQNKQKDHIIFDLEEWLEEETKLCDDYLIGECHTDYTDVLDKIQKLKERYK